MSDYTPREAPPPVNDWCWACEKTIILEGKFCGWCGTKQACEKCKVCIDGQSKYCTGCGDDRPDRSENAVGVLRDKQASTRKFNRDIEARKAKKHDEKMVFDCGWVSLLRVPALMFMSFLLGSMVGLSVLFSVLTDRKS